MKTLLTDIPITLHDHRYLCDLVLASYAREFEPCLLLISSEGESDGSGVVAKITVLPPQNYLTGMPRESFCIKDYSENEGLAEQIIGLGSPDGRKFFAPVLREDGTQAKIFLCFKMIPIYKLIGPALEAYTELIARSTRIEGRTPC